MVDNQCPHCLGGRVYRDTSGAVGCVNCGRPAEAPAIAITLAQEPNRRGPKARPDRPVGAERGSLKRAG